MGAGIIFGPGLFADLCMRLSLDILNSFTVEKTRGEIKKRILRGGEELRILCSSGKSYISRVSAEN